MSSEIIAAIIGVILGGIVTYLLNWLTRKQGNKILVSLVYQSRQVRFRETTKEDDFEILYQGNPVKNLVLTEIEIVNRSFEDVGKFSFVLTGTPRNEDDENISNYFTVSSTDDRVTIDYDEENKQAIVEVAWLNSTKKDKTEIIPLVIKSEEKIMFSLVGKMPSWKIVYTDLEKELRKSLRVMVVLAVILIALLVFTIAPIGNSTTPSTFASWVSLLIYLVFSPMLFLVEIYTFFRFRRQYRNNSVKEFFQQVIELFKE